MIHYLSVLSVSEKLHESMQDSGDALPFAAIESNLAKYADNCASWHWHEFIEFAYVVEGSLECCTPGGVYRLEPGEGYFINANVLHLNRMAPGSDKALFRVLQFDTSLLTGTVSVARRYVTPILSSARLEYQALSLRDPGQRAILEELEAMFDAAAAENAGYELRMLEGLFRAWAALFGLLSPRLGGPGDVTDEVSARVMDMLACIHDRFAEDLSVATLARAASISQREAFRAFRQVLNTTPTLYLQKYRINAAARLLVEGDRPVTDIALACGFSSPSYFCKAFKQLTGLSPRDFRRQSRQG